jgi:hypothetical protein
LHYYPVKSISEVVEVFTRETNNPKVDSVEGIMFSPDEGVIMAGYFVEKVKIEMISFSFFLMNKTAI